MIEIHTVTSVESLLSSGIISMVTSLRLVPEPEEIVIGIIGSPLLGIMLIL